MFKWAVLYYICSSVICGVVFPLSGLIKSKSVDDGGGPHLVRLCGHTD